MENEPPHPVRTVQLRGKIRVSCGDSQFCVDFQERRALIEFPSFSRLLKVKSEIDSLRESISRLPHLPGREKGTKGARTTGASRIALDFEEYRLTVRGRSIGKIDFEGGDVKFHLTPFDFITKRMS